MEVDARRLDSPLDSVLTLFDAAGKKLAENDDLPPAMATPKLGASSPLLYPDTVSQVDPRDALVTHVADSRIVYTFAKAGEYVLRIGDVQVKGGEEYAYRVKIVPALPDYVLASTPTRPAWSRETAP